MRTLAVGFLFLLSNLAQAQMWGTGMNMGNYCPQDYGPSAAAQNVNDELLNLRGQIAETNRELAIERSRMKSVKALLEMDKKAMRAVLPSDTVNSIEEHFTHGRQASEYKPACGAPPPAAVADATSNVTPAETGGVNESGTSDAGQIFSPPRNSCINSEDYWQKYVRDDGRVDPGICDDNFGGAHRKNVSDAKRDACRDGIRNFYQDAQDFQEAEARVDQLKADIDQFKRDYEREKYEMARGNRDDYTEASLCPTGHCPRKSYSNNNGALGFLSAILPAVIQGGVSLYNANQQRELEKKIAYRNQRLGFPMFPGMMGSPGPMPGWGMNPYPSPMPGYMGAFNGQYGATPGMMGPGAFNCMGNGMNPMAMNGMGGPGMLPYPGPGGMGAFGNPFMNPMMAGMGGMNGMGGMGMMPGMMNGGGPWGMPGMQGFDPFSGLNQNMFNPMMGGMNGMNPFSQYPMGMNGMGMGGPPWAPFMGNQFGQNPWGGMGYPYGGGMGGNGYPYGGMGSGYGGILGALSMDLYNMNMKVNLLQRGMGYPGGGMGYPYGGGTSYPYTGMPGGGFMPGTGYPGGIPNSLPGGGTGYPYGGGMGGNGYYGGGGPQYLPYPGPNNYGGYYTNPLNNGGQTNWMNYPQPYQYGNGNGAGALPGVPNIPSR